MKDLPGVVKETTFLPGMNGMCMHESSAATSFAPSTGIVWPLYSTAAQRDRASSILSGEEAEGREGRRCRTGPVDVYL